MVNERSIFLVLASFICSAIVYSNSYASQEPRINIKEQKAEEILGMLNIKKIAEEKVIRKDIRETPYKAAKLCNKIFSNGASNIKNDKNVPQRMQNKQTEGSYGLYVGINAGKVFYGNSQNFLQEVNRVVNKIVENNIDKPVEDSKNQSVGDDGGLLDQIGDTMYYAWKDVAFSVVTSFLESKIYDKMRNITVNNKMDFYYVASAYLGYYAKNNSRVDLESMYSKVEINSSNDEPIFDTQASILALLFNLYYNPNIKNTSLSPYVGIGVGPTLTRLRRVAAEDTLNVPWFAYQAKAGINCSIAEKVKIFLGYRHFGILVPSITDITANSIEVGLLFNF